MEIEYKGGNCVLISHKKDQFVTDPQLSGIGLKDQAAHAAVQLATQARFVAEGSEETVVVDGPGEYEVRNCSIKGIGATAHMDDPKGPRNATIYRLDIDEMSIAVVGHIHAELSSEQLESIGVVDILVVPVGNHGYTLDAKGAVDVVRAIEPKVVIPTHYADEQIKYETPQASLDDFLKELGAAHEQTNKLKLKSNQLPELLTVYEITRTR